MSTQNNSGRADFIGAAVDQVRSLFETTLLSIFGQSLATRAQVRAYRGILERSEWVLRETDARLILAHFPIPHGPHAYDRSRDAFALVNAPIRGYYDSLALVNRTWQELERQLAGSQTIVLLSSDHPYRASAALAGKPDAGIPFLLHFPGQTEAITYQPAFNTVLTRELLEAILKGEVSSAPDAARWLDRHRSEAAGASP